MTKFKLSKMLLIIVGSLSLSLGVIGIFIPVLPTTPFVLLSAICYSRGSSKLYQWLINHPIYGLMLTDYGKKQISNKNRIVSIVTLIIGLIISAILINSLAMYVIFGIIGIGVIWHLNSLKRY